MQTMKKCLLCPGTVDRIKRVDHYDILQCRTCGLEFVHPMPTAAALKAFYSTYSNFRAQDHVVARNGRQNIQTLRPFGLTPTTSLLDFGCGKNAFVRQGRSRNWHGFDQFNDHSDASLLERTYDFVTLWGVLEHLPDPAATLRALRQRLNRGGKLALTTVSTETEIPYRHKPPEHVTYWTERAIRALFRRCGFTVIHYAPYFMYQDPAVYLQCVFNAGRVPPNVRRRVRWTGGKIIHVPTNEVLVLGQKT